MPLSDEQLKHANEWFQTKLGPPICPECKAEGVSVIRMMHGVYSGSHTSEGVQIYHHDRLAPLVGLCCQNCGNIRYFSAVVMGLAVASDRSQGGAVD
jgi:hypothetical protein